MVLLNLDVPHFANNVESDQLANKPTDLDLHCLSLNMWICINNRDQVIWLADMQLV